MKKNNNCIRNSLQSPLPMILFDGAQSSSDFIYCLHTRRWGQSVFKKVFFCRLFIRVISCLSDCFIGILGRWNWINAQIACTHCVGLITGMEICVLIYQSPVNHAALFLQWKWERVKSFRLISQNWMNNKRNMCFVTASIIFY